MRKCLKAKVSIHGVGLHTGQHVQLTILPAAAGYGVVLERTDVSPGTGFVPARYDLVSDTQLCTRLTNEHGTSIGTIEHLMAALAGCGVTDAHVTLDGPEVPIADGSSAPFVDAIARVGTRVVSKDLMAIKILKRVSVVDGDRRAVLDPAERFSIDFSIAFADDAIGEQTHKMDLVNGAFSSELSDCRTFGHLHEVEALRSMGLARGGSLQNAIVVDKGRILNPEGLRRPDEFVRHKMLDAVGDLALAGAPIIGRYTGIKAGHEMTNRLLHALFAAPDCWTWAPLAATKAMGFDKIAHATPLSVEKAVAV